MIECLCSQTRLLLFSRMSKADYHTRFVCLWITKSCEDTNLSRANVLFLMSRHFRFAQLLENDRLLLVVANREKTMSIFLDTLERMRVAVENGTCRKKIRCDLIGQDFTFTYGACKRMLALCSSTKARVSPISLLHTNGLFSLNCMFLFSMRRTVLWELWVASLAYHSGMNRGYQLSMPALLATAKKCFWLTQAHEQEYFPWILGNFGGPCFHIQRDLPYH